jgi:hypothetical protein
VRIRTIIILAVVLVVLGAVFYLTSRPSPQPVAEPRPYVWRVEMEDLATMAISLPHDGKHKAWVQHEDKYWYFDEPDGPRVDMNRWGGGIPLILSGPAANRRIAEKADDDTLRLYGLADPRMRIRLGLKDETGLSIDVGDQTPDGLAFYVMLTDVRDVYTVDATWYGVLERLVLEPPYPR